MDMEHEDRPTLDADSHHQAATEAVAHLVEELQAGIDHHDAELYNRHFAADVLWGSPFGATVRGYQQLHAVHARLQEQGRGGPSSRYEIDSVLVPAPDVVVAHVRRVALDHAGRPVGTSSATDAFSEMALYVLVRRDGTWWLAAGQNTPIQPLPAVATA